MWFNWWKRDKPEQTATDNDASEPGEGEFSTDISGYMRMKQAVLGEWIEANAFQRTPKNIAPVNDDGSSIAMDSATGMDSSAIKSAFSLGGSMMPQALLAWYVKQGFIGYQACAIIAQNAMVDKACSRPGEKAAKNDYAITVNDGSEVDEELIKSLRNADKRFGLRTNMIEFERMSRVFGIRIALFSVKSKDKNYYQKPFNIDGVTEGSYEGIVQVDPYWITPELDERTTADPAYIDFYEPTWWRINGVRYHKSHLIIRRFRDVPTILRPSYFYGGLPLPQLIYERVYAAERTSNEAPLLAMTKRLNVIKTDTQKALANQAAFEDRLRVFNDFRDNTGVYAIDKEEELDQLETSLSDLDNVIMTQYQLVAALAGIPASELIETSPKGFNATGEFERNSWYDTLESIQNDSFSPLLERHYALLQRSEYSDERPFDFDITWTPLDSPTAKEVAEINEINSRTDTNLQASGSIDESEIRKRLIADERSGYNGLEPFDDTDIDDVE